MVPGAQLLAKVGRGGRHDPKRSLRVRCSANTCYDGKVIEHTLNRMSQVDSSGNKTGMGEGSGGGTGGGGMCTRRTNQLFLRGGHTMLTLTRWSAVLWDARLRHKITYVPIPTEHNIVVSTGQVNR
eukprot:1719496-Pyramimonas_sp.AAC.1